VLACNYIVENVGLRVFDPQQLTASEIRRLSVSIAFEALVLLCCLTVSLEIKPSTSGPSLSSPAMSTPATTSVNVQLYILFGPAFSAIPRTTAVISVHAVAAMFSVSWLTSTHISQCSW